MYEFPHELPNDISRKYIISFELNASVYPAFRYENFGQLRQKITKKPAKTYFRKTCFIFKNLSTIFWPWLFEETLF